MGAERVRIEPGASAVTPLVFEHYPFSHSLLAVAGWAVLIGGVHYLLCRSARAALVLGLLVVSHWVLDALVHRPDLPVFPHGDLRVGLGAWASLPLTLLIEVPIFLAGVGLYARYTASADAAGRWRWWSLVALLLLIYAGDMLAGGPPPSVAAVAWVGQAQWLFVAWAYWVDRHRHARGDA